MRKCLAQQREQVRTAHNEWMHDHRHDASVGLALGVELLELRDRARFIFGGRMMLRQDDRNIVDLLGEGHAEQRTRLRLQPRRLIVVHPVAHIGKALFGQHVWRVPRLRETRADPAPWCLTSELCDDVTCLADVGAFILDLLQVLLGVTVRDELPSALTRGFCDRRIGFAGNAVDGHRGLDPEFIERLGKPPEADAIAVFMPGPVWNVRRRDTAGRWRIYRTRHRRVDVPLLDGNQHPDRDALAIRQCEFWPACDRQIRDTLHRQHGSRTSSRQVNPALRRLGKVAGSILRRPDWSTACNEGLFVTRSQRVMQALLQTGGHDGSDAEIQPKGWQRRPLTSCTMAPPAHANTPRLYDEDGAPLTMWQQAR